MPIHVSNNDTGKVSTVVLHSLSLYIYECNRKCQINRCHTNNIDQQEAISIDFICAIHNQDTEKAYNKYIALICVNNKSLTQLSDSL